MQVSDLGIIEVNEAPPPLDLSPEEIVALADELVEYHAAFADLYSRKEQAHWGYKYLQGLMLPIERKSIEPMALALEGGDVQAMQQFIGQGQWQDEALLLQHWRLVDATLGEADGVYIVDGSDLPKQGEHSVSVARQWCGHVGKVDNCQAGVFAAYASRKGYTLLDRRCICQPSGSMQHTASGGRSVASRRPPASPPNQPWPWRCCGRWWPRGRCVFAG